MYLCNTYSPYRCQHACNVIAPDTSKRRGIGLGTFCTQHVYLCSISNPDDPGAPNGSNCHNGIRLRLPLHSLAPVDVMLLVATRWGLCMLETLHDLQDRLCEVRLPMLIVQGGDDHICDVEGARMLHRVAESTDKTLSVSMSHNYNYHYHLKTAYPMREPSTLDTDFGVWLSLLF